LPLHIFDREKIQNPDQSSSDIHYPAHKGAGETLLNKNYLEQFAE